MNSTLSQAEVFPWQQQQWDSLVKAIKSNRLPHALLFTGQSGLGKQFFARALGHFLLCHKPADAAPCNSCNACQLFHASTHPDFYTIKPEEEGKAIKVEQIRELVEKNSLTAHISSYKVHVIVDADRMNRSASNSLLKTLEEPSPNTLIILVTSRPELLSTTIKSRCQKMPFTPPTAELAAEWLAGQQVKTDPGLLLAIAQNAPLTALRAEQEELVVLRNEVFADFGKVALGKTDPVRVATNWQKHSLPMLFNWLTIWVIDIIRLKYQPDSALILSIDKKKGLQKLATAFNLSQLFEIYQQQLKTLRLLDKQLNTALLLENFLTTCVIEKSG